MRFRSSSAIDADCVVCSYIKREWKRKWYVPFRSTTPPLLIFGIIITVYPSSWLGPHNIIQTLITPFSHGTCDIFTSRRMA